MWTWWADDILRPLVFVDPRVVLVWVALWICECAVASEAKRISCSVSIYPVVGAVRIHYDWVSLQLRTQAATRATNEPKTKPVEVGIPTLLPTTKQNKTKSMQEKKKQSYFESGRSWTYHGRSDLHTSGLVTGNITLQVKGYASKASNIVHHLFTSFFRPSEKQEWNMLLSEE